MTEHQPYLFRELQAKPEDTVFDALCAAGRIELADAIRGLPVPEEVDCERLLRDQRVQGMLLGVAVGDSLGNSTEYRYDPESRYREFGTIVDHLPHANAGRLSDDAQMTFWTLERLLAKNAFGVDDVTGIFVDRMDHIVGMGRNTAEALKQHQQRLKRGESLVDQPPVQPDQGRGNGALMRFSPIVLPHLKTKNSAVWRDAALSSFVTHPHPTAMGAMLAMVHLLWRVLAMPTGATPPASWWLDEYLRFAGDFDRRAIDFPIPQDPVPKWFRGFEGTLCEFLDTRVRAAYRDRISVRDACSLDGFGSRADVVQTVPAVILVLMHHADSLPSAIVSAVNDTKDNDTVAAIVGAFVGALHGRSAIRARWLDGIRSYSLHAAERESMSDLEVMYRMSEDAEIRFCGA